MSVPSVFPASGTISAPPVPSVDVPDASPSAEMRDVFIPAASDIRIKNYPISGGFRDLEYYRARAEALVAGAGSPSERNRAITGAYAWLFLKRPDAFLWTGMAAFASQQVGYGILLPGRSEEFASLPAAQQSRLKEWLIRGNDGVYRDLAPVFLAYLDGGQPAVEALGIAGSVREGFALIDLGLRVRDGGDAEKGGELIRRGNEKLLRYEQELTLQKLVYDEDPEAWRLLSRGMAMKFELGFVPDSRWTFFDAVVPGGNVAVFADRWRWIAESMLPLWLGLAENDAAGVSRDLKVLRRRGERAKGSSYEGTP